MTLWLRNVQVDAAAADHDAVVAFWASALDAEPIAPDHRYTWLHHARAPIGVHVQRLDDGVPGFHLDLQADDVQTEAERLLDLGATPVQDGPCVVLRDPAGSAFCVCRGHGPQEPLRGNTEDVAHLHVVVLDVPTERAARTGQFWAEALGTDARVLGPLNEGYTWIAGIPGPAGEIALLVQDTGPAGTTGVHVDLHVADPTTRDTEVARLVEAGATEVSRHRHWVVLRAPGGHVLCVVPDTDGST